MITRESLWMLCTQLVSAFVKTISSGYGAWPTRGLDLVECTMAWGGFFAFHVFVSRTSATPSFGRSLEYHPDISSFRYMAGISPNLRIFFLHGWALLAIGFVSTRGLATTLGITVHYNTTIRTESVCCALVPCSVKCVCLLTTTLDIVIRYNIAIRSESVCYELITHRQVFVYCSTIILDIVVCCDTTIKPEFVRYILKIIKLLPICHTHFR